MGKAGVGLIKGIDVEEIVDTLDGYYCYNLVVMHFSHALRNRLEGQAAFLLGDEFEENAEQSLEAARKLADRIGDLGGEVTADPTRFVERSPLGSSRCRTATPRWVSSSASFWSVYARSLGSMERSWSVLGDETKF